MFASTPGNQFSLQKDVATNVLKAFPVGPDATKVGLMLYGKATKRVFGFNRYRRLADVTENINQASNLPFSQSLPSTGVQPLLSMALKRASDFLQDKSAGARSDIAKSMVVFTPEKIPVTDEMKELLQNIRYSFVNVGQDETGDRTDDNGKKIKIIIENLTPSKFCFFYVTKE